MWWISNSLAPAAAKLQRAASQVPTRRPRTGTLGSGTGGARPHQAEEERIGGVGLERTVDARRRATGRSASPTSGRSPLSVRNRAVDCVRRSLDFVGWRWESKLVSLVGGVVSAMFSPIRRASLCFAAVFYFVAANHAANPLPGICVFSHLCIALILKHPRVRSCRNAGFRRFFTA